MSTPTMKERPILFSAPMVRALFAGQKTQTRRVIKPQPPAAIGGVHPKHAAKHPAPYFDAYCGKRKTDKNPRGMGDHWCWWTEDDRQSNGWTRCPYGRPGDRLWVRENWQTHCDMDAVSPRDLLQGTAIQYPATYDGWISKVRPSIHMPRWTSRLTLEIVSVRAQRLQDITEEDAIAEGIERVPQLGVLRCSGWKDYSENTTGFWEPLDSFSSLWDSINAVPKPVLGDDGRVESYVSYPWEDVRETRQHQGKSWVVIGNPFVWVLDFPPVGKESAR